METDALEVFATGQSFWRLGADGSQHTWSTDRANNG
jgi:hypothetical protein